MDLNNQQSNNPELITPPEQNQQGLNQPPAPAAIEAPKKHTLAIVITALVLVVLIALGFGAYYVYASPRIIWQKFSVKSFTVPQSVTEDFNFKYTDHGKLPDTDSNPMLKTLSNMNLTFSGSAYVNYANPVMPVADMTLNYTVGSGQSNFSSQILFKLLGENMYVNLGDNPFFSGIFAALMPTEKVDWIKLDLKAAKEQAKQQNLNKNSQSQDLNQQFKDFQALMGKYNNKILLLDKILGRENINGTPTIHYSNKLDTAQLKLLVNDLVDLGFKQSSQTQQLSPEEFNQAKTITKDSLNILLSKLEVKNIEVWVGSKDLLIYKIKVDSNAPSINSFIILMQNASSKPNDLSSPEQALKEQLNALSFDADIHIEQQYSDYGKSKAVAAPAKSLDILKAIEDQKNKMLNPPTAAN